MSRIPTASINGAESYPESISTLYRLAADSHLGTIFLSLRSSKKDGAKLVHSLSSCKAYLHDCYQASILGTASTGAWYARNGLHPPMDAGRLIVMRPGNSGRGGSVDSSEEAMRKTVDTLHAYEEYAGFSKTRMYVITPEEISRAYHALQNKTYPDNSIKPPTACGVFMLKFSKKWLYSSHLISMYTLLARCGNVFIRGTLEEKLKEMDEQMKARNNDTYNFLRFGHVNDPSYFVSTYRYMHLLPKHMEEIYKDMDTKKIWKEVNHDEGIENFVFGARKQLNKAFNTQWKTFPNSFTDCYKRMAEIIKQKQDQGEIAK